MEPASPPSPLLDVTVVSDQHRDTVVLLGEIDVASTPELQVLISRLLAAGRQHILVDLDGVTFLDGAAVGELIASGIRTREAGGSLAVTEHAGCRRILQITGEVQHLRVWEGT